MYTKILIFNLLIFAFSFGVYSNPFEQVSGGIVLDKANGLIWQKCSVGLNNNDKCTGKAMAINWDGAKSYCSMLKLAGKTWRLPNKEELSSLVKKGNRPVIDTTAFPGTVADGYWSSTTYAPFTTLAWVVSFNDGSVYVDDKTNFYYVRCVS